VLLFDHLGQPALNVIKYDSKYEDLMTHLLSNVVIVDNEKVLAREFPNEEVTYISKEGDTKRTRHTLAGGSIGLFDGKRIGRQQAVTDLKQSISDNKAKLESIQRTIVTTEEEKLTYNTQELQVEIEQLRLRRNEFDIKAAELKTQVNTIQKTKAASSSRISEFLSLATTNEGKVSDLKLELGTLLSSITSKKEIISSQTGIIEEIAKDYGEISSHFNNAQLEWVQYQNRLESLNKEQVYNDEQIGELTQQITHNNAEKEKLHTESQNIDQQLGALKEQLLQNYEVKKVKQNDLSETENTYFSKRSVISDKEDHLKKLNKQVQDVQLQVNNQKDELKGIEFDLRSSMERLKIEFDIDVRTLAADEILAEIEDLNLMLETYEKIKKRIDNYGEINPMAVEAYDEILERFQALETQKNDILEARTSLLETIKEIDNDATDKFLTAFDKVRENFKEVFRSLFSAEDDCDLILLDKENPLASGIEIIAKPKGKRPKVLSQLSGGEKTLTATALLFSLYLLKPAPFCIFDEVDAPLDDLNIQKFSRLIRRFADASQFIIITHNKSTMANMDLLYGVYMQEQGISGITQVDFREYEHAEVFQTVNLN